PRKNFKLGTIEEANAWLKRNAIHSEPLELTVEFDATAAGNEGIMLFKGAREQTVVGVDREQGRVYLDRTHSGNVMFHAKFPGVHSAPLAANHGRVKLHIFVDACSIEVFVNDGEQVLTDLAF